MRKLRFQLFAIVYAGMLLLACVLIYGQYQRSLQLSERLVLERLQAVASTLAPRINADTLNEIHLRFPLKSAQSNLPTTDSSYLIQTQILHEAFISNKLKTPIYTITVGENGDGLRLGISSHGPSTYGLSYETHLKEHLAIYESGGTIQPYEDEWGVWLTAMVPLVASNGKQVAALEVDYPFGDFIMYAKDDLLHNFAMAAIIFLIIGILLYLFMRIALNKDEERQTQLHTANEEVREKKEALESSIRYAARMQAILQPTEAVFADFFTGHLLLDLPRDTVSGDFIWFRKIDDDRALLVVADCTGHGVPGAFMSIMGHDLLNDAVAIEKLTAPDDILQYVDKRVCAAFGCGGSTSTDGMDMAVCLIDKKANNLIFAGARRPMTIINSDGEKLINGTRRSIGDQITDGGIPFETHTIALEPESRFFLYSDGMQDQFGGEREKKLGHARLRKWFGELPAIFGASSKVKLTQLLHEWKGRNEQVDDIMVFGFSI